MPRNKANLKKMKMFWFKQHDRLLKAHKEMSTEDWFKFCEDLDRENIAKYNKLMGTNIDAEHYIQYNRDHKLSKD